MAKWSAMWVVLAVASLGVPRTARAIVLGIEDDAAFHEAGGPYEGMNWDYVYPTAGGTSVAIGYWTLLTADHYPIDLSETVLIDVGGDEFEVVSQVAIHPTGEPGSGPLADLRVLTVKNNTEQLRPLPGFYSLFTGNLGEAQNSDNMVLVGTGYSGEVVGVPFVFDLYREDRNTPRVKRWGTNGYDGTGTVSNDDEYRTKCFAMDFEIGETPAECGIATGDSGAGVFVKTNAGSWELAGISLLAQEFGDSGWNYDVWAASIPTYAGALNVLLRDDVLPGDADLDGDVDFRDYLRVKAGLGDRDALGWGNGDFDLDNDVDRDDLRAIVVNYGYGSCYGSAGHPPMAPPCEAPPGSAPEPGVAILLVLGAGGLLARRRGVRP